MRIIFHNAKVYVDKGNYQEAVLVENGLISAVGKNSEILAMKQADDAIYNCDGKTLIPGFNDSHMHFVQLANMLYHAQIENVRSIDEMIDICIAFMKNHPECVKDGLLSVGWNQDMFTDSSRLPDRHDLDRISTEIPIMLERVCGHICAVNTKLIEMLGIDGSSPQYPNGEFLIGEDGYPNGIFKGNACNIARNIIPDFTLAERREMILNTMEYAVSLGLTSVQSDDVGSAFPELQPAFDLFHEIYNDGLGLLRFRHQVCFNNIEAYKHFLYEGEYRKGNYPKDSWLTLGPLKLYKDGSLGARTALMKNGYVGDRNNHGLEWMTKEQMDAYCILARDNGMQVLTHAIGDAAVSGTIDSYEKAFIDGKNKLRHGVNHCQITDAPTLDRIVNEDILVFAQPVFIDYDMHIVEKLCGKELADTSYAFGTLLKRGAHLSYGTDAPVETCNPLINLYMAVTRCGRDGKPDGGFHPWERVDVETAVDAYTSASAYAEFAEDYKGRIKAGFYADLVLLDKDIFTIDPMQIKDVLPVLTMVGGKIVFQKEE